MCIEEPETSDTKWFPSFSSREQIVRCFCYELLAMDFDWWWNFVDLGVEMSRYEVSFADLYKTRYPNLPYETYMQHPKSMIKNWSFFSGYGDVPGTPDPSATDIGDGIVRPPDFSEKDESKLYSGCPINLVGFSGARRTYAGYGAAIKQQRRQGKCGGLGCKLLGCPPPTADGMGALWGTNPMFAKICYMTNHPVLLAPWLIGGAVLIYALTSKK